MGEVKWGNRVCVCVFKYVCMYVRMYVCTYVRTYLGTYVCTYVGTYVCTYVCMYVCMYVRHARMNVHTYVCMYVRTSCTYECIRVWGWGGLGGRVLARGGGGGRDVSYLLLQHPGRKNRLLTPPWSLLQGCMSMMYHRSPPEKTR